MICGIAQGLLIKKARARTPAKINYYRRRLREHVEGCKSCSKLSGRKKIVREDSPISESCSLGYEIAKG